MDGWATRRSTTALHAGVLGVPRAARLVKKKQKMHVICSQLQCRLLGVLSTSLELCVPTAIPYVFF